MAKGGSLDSLFNPRAIAVIGASNAPQKVGNNILRNLRDFGYRGQIYPINLNEPTILNMRAYPTVLDVPGPIDLVIIAIPAQFSVRAIEECGIKKIKNAIVISAGFKEVGEAGLELQDELMAAARKYNVRILGPNCLGVINLHNNMNASFSSINPKKGNISFISQSGALCTSILSLAVEENFGFSKFISIGNKIDLDECDLLEYLGDDPQTDVILIYIESLNNGRRFMQVANKVAHKKPVVMIKAGVTEAGAKAVSSHTGAMAGKDQIFEAALRQSGVIRVCCLEDLFNAAELFSKMTKLDNNNLLIVTNGGGMGVITVDTCMKLGIPLAKLASSHEEKIRKFLPGHAIVNNPVDVIGDAGVDRFKKVLDIAIKDKAVGVILVIVTPQSMTDIVETAELIIKLEGKKEIITNFIGRERKMIIAQEILNESEVPNYEFPEGAVNGIEMLARFNKFVKRKSEIPKQIIFNKAIVRQILDKKRKKLSLEEGFRILSALGLKTAPQIFSNNLEDHLDFLNQHNQIILKLDSPFAQHKTEEKLVTKKITCDQELKAEFTRLREACKNYKESKVCAQKFILGTELIIGGLSDRTFGSVVTLGIGGILTELLKDISFRVPPITNRDVDEMIDELKTGKLLKGFRNLPKVDIDSLRIFVHAIGSLLLEMPQIAEIEMNPVIATKDSAYAVDILITLA